MNSLSYYSVSLNLTEDEIIEIDKRVYKNRETAYLCDISALPSFLEDVVIKNITQGLASNQLDNISFLLD